MPQILRRPEAEEDLVSIWVYIAAHDVAAADRLADRLEARMLAAAAAPLIGSRRPELGGTVRSLVLGRYIIFYEPIDDGIDVLRVVHGARDLSSLLARS